jgi:RHS repeat-associated protein
LGKVTQYAYHAAGWKTNEVYVGIATNSFSYSPAGNLRELRDGKSQLTSCGYDIYGRVASKTNANNVEILRYGYDADNRLTNRWSKAKLDTKYAYDAAGNLTNINYTASTDIRYKYDVLNRLTNMVDAAGTTGWQYDSANRFTVEDGPWASDNVTNRWNTAGLRKNLAILQPAGYFNNNYSYDSAKRLSSITSGAGTFNYYYDSGRNFLMTSAKLIDGISLPNTSYITNNWDDQGRLTDTYLRNSGGTALNRHSYVYNDGNQRTRQTFTDGGYVDYLYDGAGQLYSAKTYDSLGSEVTGMRIGYKYDAAWNLNTRTNATLAYGFTVDNQNQLVSTPVSSEYTYDDNGNLEHIHAVRHYTYDDENQIINVTDDNNDLTRDFVYDGKMRLRKMIEYYWTGTGWAVSGETRYIYDGMLVVQERNSSNVPLVTYTRGTDLSGTLQGAGGIGGMLARTHGYNAGTGAWSTHNYYHADGNGNITYLVDASQNLAASYKYNPFGGVIGTSGPFVASNIYRFSSKMSILFGIYYGYRWYDPYAQRWMNRDPLYDLGSDLLGRRRQHSEQSNLYLFVDNDPISKFDSYGLLLGTLLDGIQNFACPHLSGSSCSLCCALAFQAALVADGLEGGAIISVGIAIGPITVGAVEQLFFCKIVFSVGLVSSFPC